MSSPHPFFVDRLVSNVLPISLTKTFHPIYDKFVIPGCDGSKTINELFARVQIYAFNLTHAILTQRPVRQGNNNVALFPEPKASVGMMTDAERELTQEQLELVISKLDIITEDAPPYRGGWCILRPERTFELMEGGGSTIVINAWRVKQLNQAFATGNVLAQQYWMYILVVTLCHELAHALANAVLPYGWECYISTNWTTEIGFEFENRLFGGHVSLNTEAGRTTSSTGGLRGVIVIEDWPCFRTIRGYNTSDWCQKVYYRADTPKHFISWAMPFDHINRLFQNDFWNRLPADGVNLLHPRKLIGILQVAAMDASGNTGETIPMIPADFPQAINLIPPGFTLASDGLVMHRDVAVIVDKDVPEHAVVHIEIRSL